MRPFIDWTVEYTERLNGYRLRREKILISHELDPSLSVSSLMGPLMVTSRCQSPPFTHSIIFSSSLSDLFPSSSLISLNISPHINMP